MQARAIVWLVLLLFGTAGVWRLSSRADFQLLGELVDRVPTEQKVIALTFDDGPEPDKTEQILQILAAEQIPATFFWSAKQLLVILSWRKNCCWPVIS